jgi:hypothetical protein
MADDDLAHLVHQKCYGERALQARTIHNKAYKFFIGGVNCSQIAGVRLCESQARNQVRDSNCSHKEVTLPARRTVRAQCLL